MNLRSNFITWYNNEFKTDFLYKDMIGCVEGSPWHRERDVATHTNMVVSEYISWADKNWTINTLIGVMAAVFHDTGKPSARVTKFKPERGTYYSFGGHEIISARLFEDYFVRNAERMWKLFGVRDINIIYSIEFVIEHHMPYEQPSDKVQDMATTAAMLFGVPSAPVGYEPIFQNHLTADTHGRLADDHEKKISAVDAWIVDFEKKMHKPLFIRTDHVIGPEKVLVLPIGPSGCGKSTLLRKIRKECPSIEHYSWDNLRLEWYDPDYTKAYKMSVEDPHFNARYMKVFNELIRSGKSIYVDNTNLSRKRRRPWVDAARKHGYSIVAYTFPTSLETVFKRQKSRSDKDVPADAVRQHYMTLQCPLYGEVDLVNVHDNGIY